MENNKPGFRFTSGRGLRSLSVLWALLIALIVAGLVVHRRNAIDSDFANSNVATYFGSFLVWVCAILLAFTAGGKRIGLLTIVVPVLGILAFFGLFRFERLDGELRPQFSWRWAEAPVLPSTVIQDGDSAAAVDQILHPRTTDTHQFLGPTRNATWPSYRVVTDWEGSPPEILWKQPIGEGWSSFAVQGDIGVTMEQRGEEEWVSAYDIQTGRMIWNYVMPGRFANTVAGNGPRSTPLIHADRVFACSAISQFVCLDLASGEENWSHSLNELVGTDRGAMEKEVNWGRSGSAIVFDRSVIIPLGGTSDSKDSLISFDQSTGQEVWRSGGEQISYSSPALLELGGTMHLTYVSASSISGFEPTTGEQLWRVEFDGLSPAPNVAQPIRLDDQHVFFSKGYGVGSRILRVIPADAESNGGLTKEWEAGVLTENQSSLRTKFTNPVVYQEHLYGLSDGILECIASDSLQRKWKRGRYHQGQVLLLGDCLLVFAEDGRLILVAADPTEHRELAQFSVLGNVCWNLPALSGDRLLVRNATEAACVKIGIRD